MTGHPEPMGVVVGLHPVDAIALVIEVQTNPRTSDRLVRVQCPWVWGRRPHTHLHGWPAGQDAPGWRAPHCRRGGDYFIPAPTAGGDR